MRFTVALSILAASLLTACGPESSGQDTPSCCLNTLTQQLPPCDPELGCPGGGGEDSGPAQTAISITITNNDELAWKFTSAVSAMNSTKTQVYTNAVIASGTWFSAHETRGWTPALVAEQGQTITLHAVGYNESIPAAWSNSEFTFVATKPTYNCVFTYEFSGEGHMAGACN